MILQINSKSYDSFIFNVANAETNATGNTELMRLTGDGQLKLRKTDGNNSLYIYSSLGTANNCILFQNNNSKYTHIGIGGNTFGGNYQDNFFIESTNAIVLNVNRTTSSTPNFIIKNSRSIITH